MVRARRRRDARIAAWQHDRTFTERDDDLASLRTLPPFVRLPTFADDDSRVSRPEVEVADVSRFGHHASLALSFQLNEVMRNPEVIRVPYHVVTVRTRQALPRTIRRCRARSGVAAHDQALPRTMLRHGPDVYVLPQYDGLRRVRDPLLTARGSVLSVLSEDVDALRVLGLTQVSDLMTEAGLGSATLVADGDWICVFSSGRQHAARIEAMLGAIDRLARAVPGRRRRAPVALPLPRSPGARQLAEWLLQAPGDPRPVPELAAAVHLSARTIERAFRDETGMTLRSWRRENRMRVASAMLRRRERIEHVARTVGYRDTDAFRRVFKERFGATPGAFARAHLHVVGGVA